MLNLQTTRQMTCDQEIIIDAWDGKNQFISREVLFGEHDDTKQMMMRVAMNKFDFESAVTMAFKTINSTEDYPIYTLELMNEKGEMFAHLISGRE